MASLFWEKWASLILSVGKGGDSLVGGKRVIKLSALTSKEKEKLET